MATFRPWFNILSQVFLNYSSRHTGSRNRSNKHIFRYSTCQNKKNYASVVNTPKSGKITNDYTSKNLENLIHTSIPPNKMPVNRIRTILSKNNYSGKSYFRVKRHNPVFKRSVRSTIVPKEMNVTEYIQFPTLDEKPGVSNVDLILKDQNCNFITSKKSEMIPTLSSMELNCSSRYYSTGYVNNGYKAKYVILQVKSVSEHCMNNSKLTFSDKSKHRSNLTNKKTDASNLEQPETKPIKKWAKQNPVQFNSPQHESKQPDEELIPETDEMENVDSESQVLTVGEKNVKEFLRFIQTVCPYEESPDDKFSISESNIKMTDCYDGPPVVSELKTLTPDVCKTSSALDSKSIITNKNSRCGQSPDSFMEDESKPDYEDAQSQDGLLFEDYTKEKHATQNLESSEEKLNSKLNLNPKTVNCRMQENLNETTSIEPRMYSPKSLQTINRKTAAIKPSNKEVNQHHTDFRKSHTPNKYNHCRLSHTSNIIVPEFVIGNSEDGTPYLIPSEIIKPDQRSTQHSNRSDGLIFFLNSSDRESDRNTNKVCDKRECSRSFRKYRKPEKNKFESHSIIAQQDSPSKIQGDDMNLVESKSPDSVKDSYNISSQKMSKSPQNQSDDNNGESTKEYNILPMKDESLKGCEVESVEIKFSKGSDLNAVRLKLIKEIKPPLQQSKSVYSDESYIGYENEQENIYIAETSKDKPYSDEVASTMMCIPDPQRSKYEEGSKRKLSPSEKVTPNMVCLPGLPKNKYILGPEDNTPHSEKVTSTMLSLPKSQNNKHKSRRRRIAPSKQYPVESKANTKDEDLNEGKTTLKFEIEFHKNKYSIKSLQDPDGTNNADENNSNVEKTVPNDPPKFQSQSISHQSEIINPIAVSRPETGEKQPLFLSEGKGYSQSEKDYSKFRSTMQGINSTRNYQNDREESEHSNKQPEDSRNQVPSDINKHYFQNTRYPQQYSSVPEVDFQSEKDNREFKTSILKQTSKDQPMDMKDRQDHEEFQKDSKIQNYKGIVDSQKNRFHEEKRDIYEQEIENINKLLSSLEVLNKASRQYERDIRKLKEREYNDNDKANIEPEVFSQSQTNKSKQTTDYKTTTEQSAVKFPSRDLSYEESSEQFYDRLCDELHKELEEDENKCECNFEEDRKENSQLNANSFRKAHHIKTTPHGKSRTFKSMHQITQEKSKNKEGSSHSQNNRNVSSIYSETPKSPTTSKPRKGKAPSVLSTKFSFSKFKTLTKPKKFKESKTEVKQSQECKDAMEVNRIREAWKIVHTSPLPKSNTNDSMKNTIGITSPPYNYDISKTVSDIVERYTTIPSRHSKRKEPNPSFVKKMPPTRVRADWVGSYNKPKAFPKPFFVSKGTHGDSSKNVITQKKQVKQRTKTSETSKHPIKKVLKDSISSSRKRDPQKGRS